MHSSGVHATVAGVLLAFTVPVGPGLAERFEHRFRPLSAGVAVPVFAFFAAGVTVGGFSGLVDSLSDSVALGIVAALVVGKTVGITAATWLVSRFTRAELDDELSWWDVVGLALLGGIGFTVSLLIGELAFGVGSVRDEHVKVGVLVGTVTAALLASVLLRLRNRRYKRIAAAEQVDADRDGIPDVYQQAPDPPSGPFADS
jgi:NhaA family Na+:H+ antiporter